MKNINLIIGVVVLIVIIGFFALTRDKKIEDQLVVPQYQTQTKDQAEVTVDVTPRQTEENSVFTVKLNTHSVALDFDFTEIIILKDDLGNSYKAIEWTGQSGGHHVSGDIIFLKVKGNVELQINGINGVNRSFKWDLK